MDFLALAQNGMLGLTHGVEVLDKNDGLLVDKLERHGTSFALGYAKGFYREKFVWKGHGLDLWGGVGAYLGAVVTSSLTEGSGHLGGVDASKHLERIGDACIASYLHSYGAAMGYKKANAPAVTANQPLAQLQAPPVMGAIPAAMGGSYLTADEIAHFSAPKV